MDPKRQKTVRNQSTTANRKTATSMPPLSPNPRREVAEAVVARVAAVVAVAVDQGGGEVAEEAHLLELPLPLEPANLLLLGFRLQKKSTTNRPIRPRQPRMPSRHV